MKLALCLLVAGYLVVDLCMWHGPLDRWVNTRVDAAHHVVARVQGQPANVGIFIDQTYDIGRIEDVHWRVSRARG